MYPSVDKTPSVAPWRWSPVAPEHMRTGHMPWKLMGLRDFCRLPRCDIRNLVKLSWRSGYLLSRSDVTTSTHEYNHSWFSVFCVHGCFLNMCTHFRIWCRMPSHLLHARCDVWEFPEGGIFYFCLSHHTLRQSHPRILLKTDVRTMHTYWIIDNAYVLNKVNEALYEERNRYDSNNDARLSWSTQNR